MKLFTYIWTKHSKLPIFPLYSIKAWEVPISSHNLKCNSQSAIVPCSCRDSQWQICPHRITNFSSKIIQTCRAQWISQLTARRLTQLNSTTVAKEMITSPIFRALQGRQTTPLKTRPKYPPSYLGNLAAQIIWRQHPASVIKIINIVIPCTKMLAKRLSSTHHSNSINLSGYQAAYRTQWCSLRAGPNQPIHQDARVNTRIRRCSPHSPVILVALNIIWWMFDNHTSKCLQWCLICSIHSHSNSLCNSQLPSQV